LHKFIFYTVVGRWPPEIGATKTATAGLTRRGPATIAATQPKKKRRELFSPRRADFLAGG